MKAQDLREKTIDELQNLLEEQQAALGRLRFDSVNKQIKNVREVRTLRRTIARIKTIMHAKHPV